MKGFKKYDASQEIQCKWYVFITFHHMITSYIYWITREFSFLIPCNKIIKNNLRFTFENSFDIVLFYVSKRKDMNIYFLPCLSVNIHYQTVIFIFLKTLASFISPIGAGYFQLCRFTWMNIFKQINLRACIKLWRKEYTMCQSRLD